MLIINWKQIYEATVDNDTKWILILYDISKNHYVGLPVYKENKNNYLFIKSINKYINLDEIADYHRSVIKECIYIKGKTLKITDKEFNYILKESKNSFCNYVKNNTDNTSNGISYTKWCKDKLMLINKNNITDNLKVGSIFWVNLGYNVGSELRKLRPAILWRSSSNKNMWTIIPLTSKHKKDNYYFHYDMVNDNLGTARIECLINVSVNRIIEPYFVNNKVAIITKKDNDEIIKIIKKYYAFENIKMGNSKQKYSHKENQQKVLT